MSLKIHRHRIGTVVFAFIPGIYVKLPVLCILCYYLSMLFPKCSTRPTTKTEKKITNFQIKLLEEALTAKLASCEPALEPTFQKINFYSDLGYHLSRFYLTLGKQNDVFTYLHYIQSVALSTIMIIVFVEKRLMVAFTVYLLHA